MSACLARDNKGRLFVPICPVCDSPMVFDGTSYGKNSFRCDELLDPNNDSMPLEPCMESITDGQARTK